jgi:hypothetical protein
MSFNVDPPWAARVALAASVARHPVVVPHINAAEAALVKDCEVIAAR